MSGTPTVCPAHGTPFVRRSVEAISGTGEHGTVECVECPKCIAEREYVKGGCR